MESSKERDQKLAAARKKLKKFKSQKGGKANSNSANASVNQPDDSSDIINSDSSAVESLLQLSSQLNGLLDDSANPDRSLTNGTAASHSSLNGSVSAVNGRKSPIGGSASLSNEDSLMQRNQELAGRVRDLQQKNTLLTRQMQIQTEHLAELERQANENQSEAVEKTRHELQQTREQLQVHIQTIGILVEEKQTLQKQFSVSQKHNQQKSDELEDLTSRLKASRLRVADLEKQLAVSNTQKARAESASGDNSRQLDKLKTDLFTKSRDLDEVLEQRNELEKQLQARMSQNADLDASLTDLKTKLDLSQAYIQQLTNGDGALTQPNLYVEQIEELKVQNSQLHENIAQLEESLQRVSAERMQAVDQYNQVINSLQHEQRNLQNDLDSSQRNILVLEQELQEARANNSQLSHHLEQLQTSQDDSQTAPDAVQPSKEAVSDSEQPAAVYTAAQVQELMQQYEYLRQQLQAYAKNCETLSSDNQQLARLLEDREEKVSELEAALERIQDDKNTSRRLLETVEGDKSALSRALSQNKQLKTQLEELESRFVKVTEDHMTTLTSLQHEEHVNKQLSGRLAEVEEQLSQSSQSLLLNQRYIEENKERLDHAAKMSHQQEQLADRIRHYEAKIQVMATLQNELHASQETVRALTDQNSELRRMIVHKGTSRQNSEQTDSAADPSVSEGPSTMPTTETSSHQTTQDELVENLSVALKQIEAEKHDLQLRYDEAQLENRRLSNQLMSQREPLSDPHHTSPEQFESLQFALTSLQDKYTVMMRDRAELTDRCEILEHENMQLQAESETINEYIQLYHQQRSIMKQRAEEKDRTVQRLYDDREKVSMKMAELQSLVVKLLHERQLLKAYTTAGHQQSASPSPPPADTMQAEADSVIPLSESQDSFHSDDISQNLPLDSSDVAHDSSTPLIDMSQDFVDGGERVPGVTAQRIMTLLTEIGHNNKVERSSAGYVSHILNCSHCSGPVVSM